MSQPYIAYQDVSVQYNEFVAGLSGVSLSIAKGEFVFLVGPTGAGKSTLIKLLTQEVHATSGQVLLDGRNITQLDKKDVPELRRTMGIVPQDFALLPNKRVWENVGYAMRAVGKSQRDVRRLVPQLLDRVQMGHRADAFPHQLSGGEQQRVAIARALINQPMLIVADEPTGNLDPDRSIEIMEVLEALNEAGATVLVATHDLVCVKRMKKRVVAMAGGKVEREENPGA